MVDLCNLPVRKFTDSRTHSWEHKYILFWENTLRRKIKVINSYPPRVDLSVTYLDEQGTWKWREGKVAIRLTWKLTILFHRVVGTVGNCNSLFATWLWNPSSLKSLNCFSLQGMFTSFPFIFSPRVLSNNSCGKVSNNSSSWHPRWMERINSHLLSPKGRPTV